MVNPEAARHRSLLDLMTTGAVGANIFALEDYGALHHFTL
jgi:hypothetical protein